MLRTFWFHKSPYPQNVVRCRFRLQLPEDLHDIPPRPERAKAFRDPAGIYLLGKIADGLREIGYSIGLPRGYSTCDAICNGVRRDFQFGLSLSLWREEGRLICILNAGPLPVPRYRKRPTPDLAAWTATCEDVARVLEQAFGRDSFTRYTADEDIQDRRRRIGLMGS